MMTLRDLRGTVFVFATFYLKFYEQLSLWNNSLIFPGEVSMLEADVVVGQLTGKDGPPLPIMAHPPATTSDLSLADFLTGVSQFNNVNVKQKGVKLDFKSIEAFEKAQEVIAPFSKPEVS